MVILVVITLKLPKVLKDNIAKAVNYLFNNFKKISS